MPQENVCIKIYLNDYDDDDDDDDNNKNDNKNSVCGTYVYIKVNNENVLYIFPRKISQLFYRCFFRYNQISQTAANYVEAKKTNA